MVVVSVVVLMVCCALIFMYDKVKAWSEKWLNMGKVRIVYTTCQVSTSYENKNLRNNMKKI